MRICIFHMCYVVFHTDTHTHCIMVCLHVVAKHCGLFDSAQFNCACWVIAMCCWYSLVCLNNLTRLDTAFRIRLRAPYVIVGIIQYVLTMDQFILLRPFYACTLSLKCPISCMGSYVNGSRDLCSGKSVLTPQDLVTFQGNAATILLWMKAIPWQGQAANKSHHSLNERHSYIEQMNQSTPLMMYLNLWFNKKTRKNITLSNL